MFLKTRWILRQGEDSFSLFESRKDLFHDGCEFFGVGFHCSHCDEFFPSFLESLRIIAEHSDLFRRKRGLFLDRVAVFAARKHRSVFSAENRAAAPVFGEA